MELEKEDEGKLKKLLLIAEIKEKQRTLGFWGNVSNIVALFSSLGAVVAALVALNVANSNHAKNIVEAYKSKADLLETQKKLPEIELELRKKQEQIKFVGSELTKLKNEEKDLVRKVGAIQNAIDSSGKNKPSGINIDVRKENNLLYFTVNTYPPKASVSAYWDCGGFIVFPDNPPNIERCRTAPQGEYINKIAPWEFGPALDMGREVNGFWIIVDFSTHKEIRYLNISGH